MKYRLNKKYSTWLNNLLKKLNKMPNTLARKRHNRRYNHQFVVFNQELDRHERTKSESLGKKPTYLAQKKHAHDNYYWH